MTRDRKWYLELLTGTRKNEFGTIQKLREPMTMEKAYKVISENLKRPAYVHEARVATTVFRELYGKDYASPEEMLSMNQAAKIKALEEENERLKLAQREKAKMGQSEIGPIPYAPTTDTPPPIPGLMTKDQFYASHMELLGAKKKQQWEKYKAENGIVE